jgi:hypothetical protein
MYVYTGIVSLFWNYIIFSIFSCKYQRERRMRVKCGMEQIVISTHTGQGVLLRAKSNQSNDWNRAATELVQNSAYRTSSHRRDVTSSHIFNMVWLYRSPVAVGREGVFCLLKFFLPAFSAATGGGGGGQQLSVIESNVWRLSSPSPEWRGGRGGG